MFTVFRGRHSTGTILKSVGAGVMVTSDFGRSVNPKTRGTDYAPTLLLTLLGSQSE